MKLGDTLQFSSGSLPFVLYSVLKLNDLGWWKSHYSLSELSKPKSTGLFFDAGIRLYCSRPAPWDLTKQSSDLLVWVQETIKVGAIVYDQISDLTQYNSKLFTVVRQYNLLYYKRHPYKCTEAYYNIDTKPFGSQQKQAMSKMVIMIKHFYIRPNPYRFGNTFFVRTPLPTLS